MEMLTINVPDSAVLWDEVNEEFVLPKCSKLHLEHSLISISNWESKWHKRFFDKAEKTDEETISYIQCMCLDEDVDPRIFYNLTRENYEEINAYLGDPMSATTLPKQTGTGRQEPLSSELIYYYMFACGIPEECAHWHIARLVNLIGIYGVKNSPKKKSQSKASLSRHYRELNEARRKKYNSKG